MQSLTAVKPRASITCHKSQIIVVFDTGS